MAVIHDWTSTFPVTMDSDTNMPVLVGDSAPGVRDGDRARVSHLHSLKASLIALETLGTTVTHTLYVDGNRIDVYTEDGSQLRPYKTIQAGIDAAVASSASLVCIAPSGDYNEQLTLPGGISLYCPAQQPIWIEWAGGPWLTCTGSGWSEISGIQGGSSSHQGVIMNGSGTVYWVNGGVWSGAVEAVLVSLGRVYFAAMGWIYSDLDHGAVVKSGGTLVLAGGSSSEGEAAHYDVSVEVGGILAVDGSAQIMNDRISNAGTISYLTPETMLGGHLTRQVFVDGSRVDDGYYIADGTRYRPYKTIQAAITATASGVICVAAGSYNEQVTLKTDVHLVGAVLGTTSIDYTGAGDAVALSSGFVVLHNIEINSTLGKALHVSGSGTRLIAFHTDAWSSGERGVHVEGTGSRLEARPGCRYGSDVHHGMEVEGTSTLRLWDTQSEGEAATHYDIKVGAGCTLESWGSLALYNNRLSNAGTFRDGTCNSHQMSQDVFVDKGRTDTYFENGTWEHPYKTIQAAITASSAVSVIHIAPGTYAEQITMKDGVSLVGTGIDGTIIRYNGAGDALAISGASAYIKDLSVFNDGAGKGIHLSGGARLVAFGIGNWADVERGVHIEGTSSNFEAFPGCWFGSSAHHGIEVEGTSSLALWNVYSEGEAATHYDIKIGTGCVFTQQGEIALWNNRLLNLGTFNNYLYNHPLDSRIQQSSLARPGNFLLISDTAYFVFLGRTKNDTTPKFVEFYVTIGGTGVQAAEVGFFSSPSFPNKANQSLTKLVSSGVVDNLTATGVKRNTVAFATVVPAGTYLWAGIRTALASAQPTIIGLGSDFNEGQILSVGTAGVLTAAGPWTGAIITEAGSADCPDLRGTLD